jgi:hypothetical protein
MRVDVPYPPELLLLLTMTKNQQTITTGVWYPAELQIQTLTRIY